MQGKKIFQEIRLFRAKPSPFALTDFREHLDPVESCGYAHPLAVVLLDTHDRGLTQGPAGSGQSEAFGEHDNQFKFGTGFKRAIGVEENSVGTQVTGQALLFGFVGRAGLDRELNLLAGLGTPFVCGHWKLSIPYPLPLGLLESKS